MSTAESADILESTSTHPTYEEYKDSGVDWLGEIPSRWDIARVQDYADLTTGHPFDSGKFNQSNGIPLIRIRDIKSGWTGTRYEGETVKEARVGKGDILIGMDGDFNVRWWDGPEGQLNQRVARLDAMKELSDRYLFYLLPFPLEVINDLTWYTTVKHLSAKQIRKIDIPLPPLDEQRAIVAYLDRETERIDALIEKKEQLIELLEEKRTALISRVVTKGLGADVEMQDSGVEWLGEIPAGWEAVRCGAIFREVDDRNHPDLPLLNVSIHSGVTRRTFSDDYIEQQAEDWSSYKRALEGDIVYNKMRFWQGAVGTAPIDGLVSPDYVVARTRADDLPKYYEYLFDTPLFETEVKRFSYGMVEDRFRLYWDRFKQMKTLRPPVERQRRIVEYLDRETSRIDKLIDKVEEAIEDLKEYRTAFISSAVTGQIDVRNEVRTTVK